MTYQPFGHRSSEAHQQLLALKREKKNAQRDEWSKEGLCRSCGQPRDEPGFLTCSGCRLLCQRLRRNTALRRARYRAAGLCHCGRQRDTDLRQCTTCRKSRQTIKQGERNRDRKRQATIEQEKPKPHPAQVFCPLPSYPLGSLALPMAYMR